MNKIIASKTVFISGSFDLLHEGHMSFFKQAKDIVGASGKLIVAVLGDGEIMRRKGIERPYRKLEDRVKALRRVDYVDEVIAWDQPWEDLREYVLNLKPDYLAVVETDQGLDNKRSVIEEAGGKLVIFPRDKRYSTTQIIEQLKQS